MSNVKLVLLLGVAIILVPLAIFAKSAFCDYPSKTQNEEMSQVVISKDWSADQIQGLLNCQK